MNKAAYILWLGLLSSVIQTQAQKGLLWEIKINKRSAPSYVFGTIHMDPKILGTQLESLLQFVEKTDQLAVELVPDELNPSELTGLLFMDSTLKDLLSDADYQILADRLAKSGEVNIAQLNHIKPFFIQPIIADAQKTDVIMDVFLIDEARRMGKGVVSLETFQEQVGVVNGISLREQAQILMQSLQDSSIGELAEDQLIRAYKNQDLDLLQDLTRDLGLPESFRKLILTDRNDRMTKRMEPLMRKKSVFVAVGAGHLGGRQGIIQQCIDRGYSVKNIPLNLEP